MPVDLDRTWDVIVVGTGMGGGTLGHALAQQGLQVLFLERGQALAAGPKIIDVPPQERWQQGWWPEPMMRQHPQGRMEPIFAPVGCAVGGSTVHYAAALERMAGSDFSPLAAARQQVPAWPVPYEVFVRYYQQAEALYRLNRQPADAEARLLSPWDQGLLAALRRNGLNAERLQVAMNYDAQCEECIGRVCPRQCKADAKAVCVDEALKLPHVALLEGCHVQTLQASASRVKSVRARLAGQDIELRARVVVLAAGGWESPLVLLRSANEDWPDGLANRSGQVGRNLMFHTVDLYALWAPRRLSRQGRQKKALSIRSFYLHEGRRLGYVQSMGLEAGSGNIAVVVKDKLRRWGIKNRRMLSALAFAPARLAGAVLGTASIFAAQTEDDPDPDNRVMLDPASPTGASFSYTMTQDLQQRSNDLWRLFSARVSPWRAMRLSTGPSMNFGHPCGTVRFGVDPSTSVLNPQNRAHDVDNLFVVDSSFMPRSAAVNPSLTIAANALRVAPFVAEAVRQQVQQGGP